MEYKYITENNLINKQNYMYSEFGGEAFLGEYVRIRDDFLEENKKCLQVTIHDTRKDLCSINVALQNKDYNGFRDLLDSYVKRFEVSKRLYTEYDDNWKATENASYEEMDVYLDLAICCLLAYRLTGCTKYLSCMLKIDDTLLSVKDKLTFVQKKVLVLSITCERQEFDKLCNGLKVNYK